MKQIRAAVLGLWAMLCVLLLGGCSAPQVITGVDALLAPPRLTDDQNAIYETLSSYLAGTEMHLVYPQKGEYLSAFIQYDFDGDGSDEAAVFYQLTAASAASPVNMAVLDLRQGKWRVISEVQLDSSAVEDVRFIAEEDVTLIAIGLPYAAGSGNSLLQVFSLPRNVLELSFSHAYLGKAAGDFTGDGNTDLLLVYPQEDGEGVQTTVAGLFTWQGSGEEDETDGKGDKNGFSLLCSTSVNPNISRYQQISSITAGSGIDDLTRRFYLDGYRGSMMITEELRLELSGENALLKNMTWSPNAFYPERASLVSMDYDGDGIFEIPGQSLLPGYEAGDEEILYQTTWYHRVGAKYFPACTAFVNSTLSYQFLFPENWDGKVSAYRGPYSNEITFSVWEDGVPMEDTAILSLRAVSVVSWRAGKVPDDYVYLCSRGQIVFAARLIETEGEYALTIDEVKNRFVDLV